MGCMDRQVTMAMAQLPAIETAAPPACAGSGEEPRKAESRGQPTPQGPGHTLPSPPTVLSRGLLGSGGAARQDILETRSGSRKPRPRRPQRRAPSQLCPQNVQ